jgi:hypothetical protein
MQIEDLINQLKTGRLNVMTSLLREIIEKYVKILEETAVLVKDVSEVNRQSMTYFTLRYAMKTRGPQTYLSGPYWYRIIRLRRGMFRRKYIGNVLPTAYLTRSVADPQVRLKLKSISRRNNELLKQRVKLASFLQQMQKQLLHYSGI